MAISRLDLVTGEGPFPGPGADWKEFTNAVLADGSALTEIEYVALGTFTEHYYLITQIL